MAGHPSLKRRGSSADNPNYVNLQILFNRLSFIPGANARSVFCRSQPLPKRAGNNPAPCHCPAFCPAGIFPALKQRLGQKMELSRPVLRPFHHFYFGGRFALDYGSFKLQYDARPNDRLFN